MQTLTVHGTNLAGQPDTGDQVLVFNVDNCGKLNADASQAVFYHGTTKLSVPAGHYWAIGLFGLSSTRLVVLPQITVTGPTTVAVSARSATAQTGFTTPRPATLAATLFTLLRASHGHTESVVAALLGGGTVRVNPVRRPPATGTLQAYTGGYLTPPAGQHGTPYIYGLNFPAPAGTIPSSLHYTARPAGLATIHDRFYQDTPSTGLAGAIGGAPAEFSAGATGVATLVHMPGRQTQYLSASPPEIWASGYTETQTGFGGQSGPYRLLHAGQQVTEDLGRYPLHPTPNVIMPGAQAAYFGMLPTAARTADQVAVDITPFGDNHPGDTGSGYGGSCARISQCTGRYTLYQNGTKIASGNAITPILAYDHVPDLYFHARLSAHPAQLKLVLTASRAADKSYQLSATSRDVWTWHTSRPSPAATLPAGWACGITPKLVLLHHCAVQPMLMLRYQVAGLSQTGATRPGRQVIGIDATRLQLAPAARIASVGMTVSYDGGKTWHTAHVTRVPDGRFRATFTAPASTPITLRTHATDSSGGSITETITSAYTTAS